MRLGIMSAIAVAAASSLAHANPIVSGFNGSTVGACDDCYTSAQTLGFNANFFGQNYGSTYVSNNGYVTFGGGQGTYTPTGLTAAYGGLPIIAAFYADVDTRGTGSVTFGTGTYNGYQAFGVNWNAVGYYPSATNRTDTFQELLISRPDQGNGAFDIIFNYGSMQWETGGASGGSGGLGGTSAAVGYANGSQASGTYYELPGSLMPGSLIDGGPDALATHSNDGVAGQYLFQVRNGIIIPPPVPEPATIVLFATGLAFLGFAARRRGDSAG